jgi:betaine-aldehyde dehydrogenase
MISAAARRGVHAQVEDALAKGARLVCGGTLPPRHQKGFYYPPTVLADCHKGMQVYDEETFGPVVTVTPFDRFEEALEYANDSDYGLGAGLYTHDARLVHRFAHQMEAGTLWVNEPLVDNYAAPFGGMKLSGIGRELGYEGLDAFRQVKHLHWDLGQEAKPWWFRA